MTGCNECVFYKVWHAWDCSFHKRVIDVRYDDPSVDRWCSTTKLLGNQCIHCGTNRWVKCGKDGYKHRKGKMSNDSKYPGPGVVFQEGNRFVLEKVVIKDFFQCINCHLKYKSIPVHEQENLKVQTTLDDL